MANPGEEKWVDGVLYVWLDGKWVEILGVIGASDGSRGEADDGAYQATIDAVTQANGSDAGAPNGDSITGMGASLDGFVGSNHKWLWAALVMLGLVMVVASHKRRR